MKTWLANSVLLAALGGCDADSPTRDQPTEEDFTVRVRGVPFIRFGGGTFTMGRAGDDYASPPTQVTVRPFQIMKTEVTVGMYLECVDAGACELLTPDFERCSHELIDSQGREAMAHLPMNCVNWTQAQQFARWFGHKARLPTEAEWEFAATGGTGRPYPWGTQPPTCDRVVRRPDSFEEDRSPQCTDLVQPVCSRPAGHTPAPQVLCDMLGNVGELMEDDFHPAYDCASYPPDGDYPDWCPAGGRIPSDGSAWVETPRMEQWRVARGFGAGNAGRDVRVKSRSIGSTEFGGETSGFRLVRDEGQP